MRKGSRLSIGIGPRRFPGYCGDGNPENFFRNRFLRPSSPVWKGPPAGYPGTYPGKLSTLLQILTPVPGTYHDLFQWHDPLPEFGDWINLFPRLIK